MKRIISILKTNFKVIIGIIIGMLLAGTGVYAATTLASSSVAYDNSTSGGSSTNVKGALDELYDMASTHCPDDYNCYEKEYQIGTEVTLAGESFNIISETENSVTLFAKYNLGTDYKQNTTANAVEFSESSGWSYTPGPKEISIQLYNGNAKTYVKEYVSYLQNELGDIAIIGNLITLNEIKELGCTISDDYSNASGLTCANSSNASWLSNGQFWWTRSAAANDSVGVWYVNSSGRCCKSL